VVVKEATGASNERRYGMVNGNTKYSETFRHGRVWLGKRADTGVWYLKYKIPSTGQNRERSAATTVKRDAIHEADLLADQLVNQKYGVADGSIQLKTMFDKFVIAKAGRVKTKTLERLKTTISSFQQWISGHQSSIRLARHLNPEIIRQFQSDRKNEGLSLRSVNNDIMNLHTVFRWAIRECLMATSPADYSKKGTIDRYTVPRFDPAVYSDNEVMALIAQAEAEDDSLTRDLIVVFAGTGMRFEETAHLKPSNIMRGGSVSVIEVRAQKDWSPKDPLEVKRIPMLPEVEEVIRRRCSECRSGGEFLFKNTVGRKIHVNRARERLQKLFSKVGIGDDRRLHWHSFRNYFVIRCLKKGVTVNAIMQWTGHDSASMVLHYAKAMNQEDVQSEFRKLTEIRGKSGEQDLQGQEKG
jgi:integrase